MPEAFECLQLVQREKVRAREGVRARARERERSSNLHAKPTVQLRLDTQRTAERGRQRPRETGSETDRETETDRERERGERGNRYWRRMHAAGEQRLPQVEATPRRRSETQ